VARPRSEIRFARIEDAEVLAASLAAADRLELQRLNHEPLPTIRDAILQSEKALAVVVDGELLALTGVVRRAWGGQFWLLCSERTRALPVSFMRGAKAAWAALSSGEALLANMVDAEHGAAGAMARHFGFHVCDAEPVEPFGELFRVIVWRNPSCALH
jgi:hypothetical protein